MVFARHISLDFAHPDDLAISRHRFAQYVLASKGFYNGPSLEELKATCKAPPAAEHRQEVLDRYNCIDDSITGVDPEDQTQVDYLAALNSADALKELYNDTRPMKRFQHDMDDALSQIRYNYLKSRSSLSALRIARFLMPSVSEQEKMMETYGWAWKAVQSPISKFKTNEGFNNEILESVKDA
ncbi:hypothetical protein DEU56DRAFT_757935 [Suillus clintonianus]|uniref:uncharacterized protein n=1 Tax=Suillus clintonianus TaxID=1904413 RepID=UPI001B8615E7|nr:uncharacterized protein DEU56DRAFT_757935 [Suillus clintonianus]KAG2130263.1 hypothetical protein DEU56DRAFT_757935 [Suillus clintonianus]